MDIQINKMSPALAEDFFRFFDEIAFADHPEWGCDCYCCFYHATSAQEWEARTGAQNKAQAREMILAGKLRGLLAYADGLPVAWCHYDQKDLLPGIKTFYPEFLAAEHPDDTGKSPLEAESPNIAAIVCFTVAQGYRQKGIAGQLLDFACRELAEDGMTVIEAYPTTASGTDEHNYHGPLSMYLSHGFTVYKELAGHTIFRLID